LIVSRWTGTGSFRSTVSDIDQNNVIASSSLIIVRIKDSSVIPEYLALYLNSFEWQNKIIESVSGSYIKAISRKKFEEIEIPIPPLIQQKNLVGLSQNIIRQEHIYNRKKELKQNLITATLKNLIHS
jgi:type I restriction enzyme S subunit